MDSKEPESAEAASRRSLVLVTSSVSSAFRRILLKPHGLIDIHARLVDVAQAVHPDSSRSWKWNLHTVKVLIQPRQRHRTGIVRQILQRNPVQISQSLEKENRRNRISILPVHKFLDGHARVWWLDLPCAIIGALLDTVSVFRDARFSEPISTCPVFILMTL